MTHKLAVIGLEAAFGDGRGIDSFNRYIANGEYCPQSFPKARLKALRKALGDKLKLPEGGWLQTDKQPVAVIDDLINRGVERAGLNSSVLDVMLVSDCIESEMELLDLQDSIRSLMRFDTVAGALKAAVELVQKDAARTVAVVALHMLTVNNVKDIQAQFGDAAELADDDAHHTLAFDASSQGHFPGEGAGLVLLKHAAQAVTKKTKILGFIDDFTISEDPTLVCEQAMQAANLDASNVQFIETCAVTDTQVLQREFDSLLTVYGKSSKSERELSCGFGGARSVIGNCGDFNAVASLIKSVMCVYNRYVPGTPGWQSVREDLLLAQTPFYVPSHTRTWYTKSGQTKRIAGLNIIEKSFYTHLIVSENSEDKERPNRYLAEIGMFFLPLADDTQEGLLSQLKALSKSIGKSKCLHESAIDCFEKFKKHNDARYALVVLGEEKDELLSEIEIMAAGVKDAFTDQAERKTPKGSYLTTRPVGKDGGVAFVYPGVGAAYVGLGQNLFHMFPEAYNGVEVMSRDMSSMVKDDLINPRRQKPLAFKEIKALDLELRRDLASISEAGVAYAYIFTRIFQQTFSVKPEFAMGYSMGEISMFAALDAWKDPALLCERIGDSPTFNHNLTGEMHMLREHWDLPPVQEGIKEKIWETYTIKGTVEEVTDACSKEERVYVTIINTPDSVLIGGEPAACQRVIDDLGVRGMAMEIPSAIHSEPAFKEYANMEALFTMDIADKIDTKIFSTSCYLPIPQRSKSIANSIAKCFCEQVDFPRLVNTAYDKGARIFVEMGAGRSCCSWIDKILKHGGDDKPHVSIPVNAKGTPDHVTIFRALAKLVSHRVDVDLAPLFYGYDGEAV